MPAASKLSALSAFTPQTIFGPLAALSRALLPGLAITAFVAVASVELARLGWLQSRGIGALTLSIVIGMVVGNLGYDRVWAQADDGVAFSKTHLLRAGIVLYGLRLTFQDIGSIGWNGVVADALMLCSTFGIACYLGTRWFGLDRPTAMLIGAGSSICGAAAVMATAPVVRARAEQVMVAVATVVVFGTLAMVFYPLAYDALLHRSMSPEAFGIFAGSTIHEVAQVVVAGHAVGERAGDLAVIAKMVRVMMLAPFLIGLSAWLGRADQSSSQHESNARQAITIPWFALGFVALAGLRSLSIVPAMAVDAAAQIDTVLLAMAMAGLGLTTRLSAIRRAGVRPLGLAAVLFAWLMAGGFAINAGWGALAR
ncbi:YeiH family protein [Xylophilus sp. GOD-11R]|uniref:YeiH family protein n=1 Tax=Xylophilus sp. GOD-11R TaxID=3089814 RepID=UPI00298BED73|nr:YeiH family protein [Xylophilus sp. GOD-11R]WPB54959.1 YeiH family protein [Xylophilus sp. GOD-11R]